MMKNTMSEIYRLGKTGLVTMSIALLLFAYGQTARADLAAVGATDPVTGFPSFYQDAANLQLGPCDHEDFAGGANNPPCGGLALIDPVNGGGFVAGNIEEVSFYRAEANMTGSSGELLRLRMEVQGGVLPPASVNNAVRLRMRNIADGTYIVDHPFGQETVVVAGDDIDMELPGGVLASAPNFDPALGGNIMCFWGNGTGLVLGDSTFIGDGLTESPLIPVAACPQLAGDLVFRVSTSPGGQVVAETNAFAVEGKISPLGVRVQRATYEQTQTTTVPPVLKTKVDVWATSVPGELIPVSGAGLSERDMVESPTHPGHYYFRKRLQLDTPVPATIDVNGMPVPLVDEVTITKAQYRVSNSTLTVRAKSSDQGTPTMLTVRDQFGGALFIGPSPINEPILISPDTPYLVITVESDKGGTDTQSVDVVGGNVFQ